MAGVKKHLAQNVAHNRYIPIIVGDLTEAEIPSAIEQIAKTGIYITQRSGLDNVDREVLEGYAKFARNFHLSASDTARHRVQDAYRSDSSGPNIMRVFEREITLMQQGR